MILISRVVDNLLRFSGGRCQYLNRPLFENPPIAERVYPRAVVLAHLIARIVIFGGRYVDGIRLAGGQIDKSIVSEPDYSHPVLPVDRTLPVKLPQEVSFFYSGDRFSPKHLMGMLRVPGSALICVIAIDSIVVDDVGVSINWPGPRRLFASNGVNEVAITSDVVTPIITT